MSRMIRSALILAVAFGGVGPAAQAQSLRDNAAVVEGLIAAAIAWEIGDKCDEIDARLIRGISFLNGLKAQAREAGHSDAEIDAFIEDRAEKDRLEAIARQRLAGMGAVPGEWATYCRVGETEMAAGSQIGRLLW
jgi:hypothetical protein